MENTNLIWSFTFPEDIWYCWHLAGANIFVRRRGKYWDSFCRTLQWSEHSGVYSGPVQEEPAAADLINTAVRNEETATLQMCFPEKPFLINLEALRLLPGTETSLTLQLPPAFRLIAGDNPIQTEPEETLFTFTPFTLKEAWYGEDTMKGIICSVLPGILIPDSDTPATAGTAPATASPPGIECTVLIRNRTKGQLDLTRVPLYTDTLAVYEINGKFISDQPLIEPHGSDFRETIIKEQGVLLAPPAIKSGMGDTLIRRGTEIIRNITGL